MSRPRNLGATIIFLTAAICLVNIPGALEKSRVEGMSFLFLALAQGIFGIILLHELWIPQTRAYASILFLTLAACAPASQTALPAETTSAHEGAEGPTLAGTKVETVYAGALCPTNAPLRQYNVVAISVEITLNRYLDYDPNGRMYVLEQDVNRVRQEEAKNKDARAGKGESAVSIGLQGDAIQPLTIRVNQGECLRVRLRNDLKAEAASLHLHGSSLHLMNGMPAIATNPNAFVQPGKSAMYEWWVADDEPEGTHYFHSHGDDRVQTNHGLFGAVIVEPKGSAHLDPISGAEMKSGWAAMINSANGKAFREFAIYYDEISDSAHQHLDKNGRPVALVDPYTDSYRPGSRAINYRSEPFMNRLALQQQLMKTFDKSAAYSSYVFGDPATPIARSYLGDPVKQRIIHAGADTFHVHHVHGGAIRWRRQSGVEPTRFDSGLDKHPPLIPEASERIDSQSLGPSEVFDLEDECGSGGCQQSVGDYLIHCHVANHYLSGMWMIWRVYNTKQDSSVSLDGLPPLQELPDRTGQMQVAVTSDKLIGTTVDWYGKTFQIAKENLSEWVERQLPPQGIPKGYDASVLDWRKNGDVYSNEQETDQTWPGYRSPNPGSRPPFYFDPKTGKLAYPFLHPHLGKRPPFAPNHGPAPFLEPIHQGLDPAQPGENGPWSLCPTGTKAKQYAIHAITLPIPINQRTNLIDPSGTIYVLREEEDQVRADNARKTPLAIRANAGEDCVDIVLKNELEDNRENAFFSKVDLHIHFVQFDVQASDGVDTGFNYEQSVRPFKIEGEALAEDTRAGAVDVRTSNTQRFQSGILVGVGMEQDRTFEIKRVLSVTQDKITFDAPLKFNHAKGEYVSAEFVRYRWYPDVQFGTAYFHDHVDALHSWRHGLFGALISEPPRSIYRDPHTGSEVKSGAIADIHTDAKVSADIAGSFREMVMFIQDENPITAFAPASGSSFNLRAEPFKARPGNPWQIFSSRIHGDPATPLLETFLGDPIVVRTLVGGTNDVHTWHLDGHWFRQEPWSNTSPPISTIHLGISERYDLSIPRAGGPQQFPGDYLYYSGRIFKLREGSWGIVRVYDPATKADLRKLPNREPIQAASSVCPNGAPTKEFAVSAIDAALPMLDGKKGKIFVLQEDRAAVLSGSKSAEPLVLHVNVGDCISVNLSNEMSSPVSFHADMLAFDPKESYGISVGTNPDQAVMPSARRAYTFYAHPEIGETTALVRDGADVIENPRLGLYGAIIVGPRGARYTDSATGQDVSLKSNWRVDVHPTSGSGYRDIALFMQDEDPIFVAATMPYVENVTGVVGLNYRAEPSQKRLSKDKNTAMIFNTQEHGEPATPLIEAFVGDQVRLHVLAPYSEQAHVFSVENHRWQFEQGRTGSDLLNSVQVGGLEAVQIVLTAGDRYGLPGDYIYGDHREPYREAGLWGLFRVYPKDAKGVKLLPLQTK